MKNFDENYWIICSLFAMSFNVNSQSKYHLPQHTNMQIEYMQGMCGYVNGNVYVRITDENGNRLNENSWNGASLEHSLESGFPNESMSSFTISPGSYNYYVEAGGRVNALN